MNPSLNIKQRNCKCNKLALIIRLVSWLTCSCSMHGHEPIKYFYRIINTRTQVTFTPDMPIIDLQWNCEKFNMEEREEMMLEPRSASRLCVLAICFKNGDIKLVNSYDDVSPVVINNFLIPPRFSRRLQYVLTGISLKINFILTLIVFQTCGKPWQEYYLYIIVFSIICF